MKNRRNIILIAAIALVSFLLLWWLFLSGSRPVYSWQEHYRAESKDPYGTYVLYELLRDYRPEGKVHFLEDSLRGVLPDQAARAAYVFVGESLYPDSLDLEALLRFVAAGNTALISSKTLPVLLSRQIYPFDCSKEGWNGYDFQLKDTVVMRLGSRPPDFPIHFQRREDTLDYAWSFIPERFICNYPNGLLRKGYIEGVGTNFASLKYGKGTFLLHATPLAFSNIALLDSTQLEYAERVFAELPPGDIYWDYFNKLPVRATADRFPEERNRSIYAESPLRYVLSQPPLAWSWYLLLALGLLYLFFRAKRRQRIIPVQAPNVNTSLEFISTIGRLYFLQQNHGQLCRQKTRLFFSFLRNRYGLQWRKLEDHQLPELAALSGLPGEFLEKLSLMSRNIEQSSYVSENTLTEYHRLLAYFYRNCK